MSILEENKELKKEIIVILYVLAKQNGGEITIKMGEYLEHILDAQIEIIKNVNGDLVIRAK